MILDHVTIRTRDFFVSVFDMAPGERPELIRRIPGCWLYSGGQPLVHIIGAFGDGADHAAEAIDHVGFRLTRYGAFRAKLGRLGIPFSTMDLDDIEERRLFFRAPGGPLIEAVFAAPVPSDP